MPGDFPVDGTGGHGDGGTFPLVVAVAASLPLLRSLAISPTFDTIQVNINPTHIENPMTQATHRTKQEAIIHELENKSLAAVGAYFKDRTYHLTQRQVAKVAEVTHPAIIKYYKTMTWERCRQILNRLGLNCAPIEEILMMRKLQTAVFRGETITAPTSSENDHTILVETGREIHVVHVPTNTVIDFYRKVD